MLSNQGLGSHTGGRLAASKVCNFSHNIKWHSCILVIKLEVLTPIGLGMRLSMDWPDILCQPLNHQLKCLVRIFSCTGSLFYLVSSVHTGLFVVLDGLHLVQMGVYPNCFAQFTLVVIQWHRIYQLITSTFLQFIFIFIFNFIRIENIFYNTEYKCLHDHILIQESL